MTSKPDIICIGSVLWDTIGRTDTPMKLGYDVPGRISRFPGGVAMNIAMTLAQLGRHPAILTVIGRDREGDTLVAECERLGVSTAHVFRSDTLPTDRYMAIECNGSVVAAIADASSLEAAGDAILAPLHNGALGEAAQTSPLLLDGNLTEDLLHQIATDRSLGKADLRVAPASPGKAARLRAFFKAPKATLYLNKAEAELICEAAFSTSDAAALAVTSRGAYRAIVTDGSGPVADAVESDVITALPPPVEVRRITGAGDTFMATHIAAEMKPENRSGALRAALKATAAFIATEGNHA